VPRAGGGGKGVEHVFHSRCCVTHLPPAVSDPLRRGRAQPPPPDGGNVRLFGLGGTMRSRCPSADAPAGIRMRP
jgi:hypothetical protein